MGQGCRGDLAVARIHKGCYPDGVLAAERTDQRISQGDTPGHESGCKQIDREEPNEEAQDHRCRVKSSANGNGGDEGD